MRSDQQAVRAHHWLLTHLCVCDPLDGLHQELLGLGALLGGEGALVLVVPEGQEVQQVAEHSLLCGSPRGLWPR